MSTKLLCGVCVCNASSTAFWCSSTAAAGSRHTTKPDSGVEARSHHQVSREHDTRTARRTHSITSVFQHLLPVSLCRRHPKVPRLESSRVLDNEADAQSARDVSSASADAVIE